MVARMLDRLDRLVIAAGCWFHQWLDRLQGRVFAVVDDASCRVMRRSWRRRQQQRQR
jgi:hypothetical protein